MKINNINTAFGGQLYLKNPSKWTSRLQYAMENNRTIQETLEKSDIVATISTKVERHTPSPYANHRKGETLYKINLSIKDEAITFFDKLKNALGIGSEKIALTRRYHSEATILDRISNLDLN